MSFISNFIQWHTSILDRLIPDPTSLSDHTLNRARLFVGIISYALLLNLVLLGIRFQESGLSNTTISSLFGNILFVTLLIAYYTTNKLNVITDFTVIISLISISYTIFSDDGLVSRGLFWLSVFPIVSQSISKHIQAKEVLILCWGLILFLYQAHINGLIPSSEPNNLLLGRAMTTGIVLLFITIVTIIYDKSRQQLSEKLTKEKENAEQAFRLKSEFLATMSHELRTPFNGVLGMLELLNNSNLTDQQRHRVGLAKNSAESLLLLINDILDFSKLEAGKQKIECIPMDLHELFGNTVEAMSYQANNKGIEIVLDLHQLKPILYLGDPNRIRQITTNLLNNAIKFTSTGGVLIKVRSENIDENFKLSVSVSDTGIGIPQSKLDMLFNPFTQIDSSTSRQFGGTGLGLAIAKQLSKLMGGDINVTSTEGKGSTFKFHVQIKAHNEQTNSLRLPNIKSKLIVVIDDNIDVTNCFKNSLHHLDIQLKCFNSPENAQQYLEKDETPLVDLMIIDINMPKQNGVQFTKQHRALDNLKNCKFVMMSEINTIDGEEILNQIGIDFSFPKPVTYKDIVNTLSLLQVDSCNKEISINSPDTASQTDYKTETHILVVDDNPINLEVAAALLDSFDIQPVLATGAEEAIKILNTHPKKDFIHGILMDCQMPNMDGFEATQAIRNGAAGESYKNIPIIALTANAMKSDKEKCLSSGMNDFLTKPIDMNKLITVINNIIRRNE